MTVYQLNLPMPVTEFTLHDRPASFGSASFPTIDLSPGDSLILNIIFDRPPPGTNSYLYAGLNIPQNTNFGPSALARLEYPYGFNLNGHTNLLLEADLIPRIPLTAEQQASIIVPINEASYLFDAVPEPATWALMLLGLILFLLMESPANARYHHRHYHHSAYHCRSGMIWLRHDQECVYKYVKHVQPAPVEPAPVAKKSDRLPKEDPPSDLPYWEPFPIMGKPSGRWWHI